MGLDPHLSLGTYGIRAKDIDSLRLGRHAMSHAGLVVHERSAECGVRSQSFVHNVNEYVLPSAKECSPISSPCTQIVPGFSSWL